MGVLIDTETTSPVVSKGASADPGDAGVERSGVAGPTEPATTGPLVDVDTDPSDAELSGWAQRGSQIARPLNWTFGVLLGVIVLIMFTLEFFHERQVSLMVLEQQKVGIVKLLQEEQEHGAAALTIALDGLAANADLHKAFVEKDRQELLALAKPIFDSLRQRHHVTHLSFVGKDRTGFLRVHDPERYGDRIDRRTMADAVRLGKLASGFDLDQSGVFSQRAVQPWYSGKELIGYIELGIGLDEGLRHIEDVVGAQIIEVYDKADLDFAKWIGIPLRGRVSSWDVSDRHVVSASRLKDIPAGLVATLAAQDTDPGTLNAFMRTGSKLAHYSGLPLTDTAGQRVGSLVIVRDVTKDAWMFISNQLLILMHVVSVGVLASFIFNHVSARLQESVQQAHAGLETEVEKRTHKLKESHALNSRLARIVEDSINEVFVFDSATLNFLRVNASACRNLGYTAEELAELTPLDLKPAFTRDQFDALIEPLRRGEKNHLRFQTIHKRRDGTCYDVDILLQQIRSGGRDVFAAIVEDVTDRKKLEEERIESEARFRAVFDNTPVCINLKDKEGRYLFANKRYEEWWGLSAADVLGKRARDFQVDAFGVEALTAAEQRVLETGEKHETEISVHRPVDGKTYERLLIKFPVKLPDGTLVGLGTVAVDITERKQAERELTEHRDQLQVLVDMATLELKDNAEQLKEALAKEKELNELQRQFVSMASHELRTPLAIIDGNAQRLKRQSDRNKLTRETIDERVGNIRASVERMTGLMERTLTAALMEEGKITVDIAPCDIAKVVGEVCARQQEIAEGHSISCDLSALPDAIQADAGALEQVFTNLLSNAVKYSPQAPQIDVSAYTQGERVVVAVRDRGLGIDEEDLRKLGNRFFRAKTSVGIAGTGIGLNLVHQLVTMHGGELHVDSTLDEGSTFSVALPIAGPGQSQEDAAEVA